MTIQDLFELLRKHQPVLWAMAMDELNDPNLPLPPYRQVCQYIVARMM